MSTSTNTKPKYVQIGEDIRGKILTGEYASGERIPTEMEFQNLYGVSRHTVRQAITQLAGDGYLRSEKGSGTYVSDEYTQKTKSTSQNAQKKIGIITTYFSEYIFPSIIRGVEHVVSAEGYSLSIASTQNTFRLEKQALENMLLSGIDGLIVEPTQSSKLNPNISYYMQLKEMDIPFLMINAFYEELETPSLRLDDELSGYLATKYLIDHGHKEIGIISKTDDLQGKYRLRGYLKAISENRLPYRHELTLYYNTAAKKALFLRLTDYLSEYRDKLTALVCYNDEIALIVINVCNNLGIRIPEDLSIIGQDNSKIMRNIGLNLTTLSHPQEQMGEDAAHWIMNKVKNKKSEKPLSLYEPAVIEGDSVRNL
ncbi:MAG: GntR family transcriptional regulator [Clostridiales Family XIII bacterium]|jgi:GntR family transcriptional regulator of arabinose operon|nr:GntR family transcriptional regulator [Clostridiales Family XIII bacterium]